MRRGRALRSLLQAGAALLALAVPPLAAQRRPELEAIHFEGNETFSSDSLRLAIVNRGTECRIPLPVLDIVCRTGWGPLLQRHDLLPAELPRDVARLKLYYWQRGYREAEVDTTIARPDSDDVEVTFHIQEGRPVLVDSLAVVGAEGVPPDVLTDLPLQEGDRLSSILLEATRDTLDQRLKNSGYAFADVLRSIYVPADSSYTAQVTYDVDPGPLSRFGDVVVDWGADSLSHDLSETVVRRQLPFGEGDLYSREAIAQAQRNLFALQIVRNVNIKIDTLDLNLDGRPDSIVPVTVTVAEGDVHRVGAAAGWSTAECLSTEAHWINRNFLGGARRVQLRGRLSNLLAPSLNRSACPQAGDSVYAKLNWQVSLDFNQPYLFSPRNGLAANVYAERQSLPDVFVREAVGVNVILSRTVGQGEILQASYRPQLSRLDAAEVFFCTSFVVCTPEDVSVLQGANWLSPLGANLSANRTNSLLNPTDGWQGFLDLEHAAGWTGSDFAYTRLSGEGSWYRSLGGGSVWAARLRAGWIGAGAFANLTGTGADVHIVHPQKRFYSGGANSVRGYPQNRLGPQVLTVDVAELMPTDSMPNGPCTPPEVMDRTCDADPLPDGSFFPRPTGGTRMVEGNLEYRFRLAPSWEGATFLDFGQVWGERDTPRLGDVAWTPGFGVRYFSPVGPVRLDLGYRTDRGHRLPVVTSQIRPAAEGEKGAFHVPGWGDYVRVDELALLGPAVLYGEDRSFFQRLQLHFSIGQAF